MDTVTKALNDTLTLITQCKSLMPADDDSLPVKKQGETCKEIRRIIKKALRRMIDFDELVIDGLNTEELIKVILKSQKYSNCLHNLVLEIGDELSSATDLHKDAIADVKDIQLDLQRFITKTIKELATLHSVKQESDALDKFSKKFDHLTI